MTRKHLSFECEGAALAATLDEAEGATGLLIVSGGNEVRSGAWAGQAKLAAAIAGAGHPVFRFDRRGVGDSDGPNGGFRSSERDIAAAIAAFRTATPQLTRIVAFGNCDAASALMLISGAGSDALVLANPWTFNDDTEAEAPASVVRAHYRQRLSDPRAILRLLSGRVPLGKLLRSLFSAAQPAAAPSTLAREIAAGLSNFAGPVTILIAERDRTAIAFLSTWKTGDPRVQHCPGASHSFVEPDAQKWLQQRLLEALQN